MYPPEVHWGPAARRAAKTLDAKMFCKILFFKRIVRWYLEGLVKPLAPLDNWRILEVKDSVKKEALFVPPLPCCLPRVFLALKGEV